MKLLHIAGYRFVDLTDTQILQQQWHERSIQLDLRGTILLSTEGVNINLAGEVANIHAFIAYINTDTRFANMRFHQSYPLQQTYKRLKIKLKREIITLRQPSASVATRAPAISPVELKQWLDEKRDITLVDTRNDFEIGYGTFNNAVNLNLQNFGELPQAVNALDRKKTVVMFCTGGIRCEKAAVYMLNDGFHEVYQLDGGILGYFAEVGGAHYQGDCFVFDERISVNPTSIQNP